MGIGHHIGGNDAFTNGIGDMRADKGGTHDIQDAGYKNSLTDGDGLGTHSRCHGVGNIIGTDVPGHVKPKNKTGNKNQILS